MAAVDTTNADTPEEALRKRIAAQQAGSVDPTASATGTTSPAASTAPAPFVTNPNGIGTTGNTGVNGGAAALAAATTVPTPIAGQQGGGKTYDSAPAGFDQTKWMDPNYHTAKYDAARIIGQFGHSPDGVRAALPQIQALYPNAKLIGVDKIDFGDGYGPIDVIRDAGGANAAQHEAAPAAAPSAQTQTQVALPLANRPSGGPAPGQSVADWVIGLELSGAIRQGDLDYTTGNPVQRYDTQASQAAAPSSAPPAPPAYNQQIRDLIMQRLQAAGQPVNESDAYIAQPLSAARDELARTTDQERTALAEHLYAGGGLNSNAITQGIQQSSERNAGALSTLRGTLIQRELTSRRNELDNLLQTALASGDAEAARNVQMQMQAIDNELRREFAGIDLAKFGANLNQTAAIYGLNG